MDLFLFVVVFLLACYLLYYAGEMVVENLMWLARFLGLTEFVVAFFVMAFAASLPNFFVGVTSAIGGIPELSLGDIFGNNIIALTLAVAVSVLASNQKTISAKGITVQTTVGITSILAILPLILMANGVLSRTDGLILISCFLAYVVWLFSKKERFSRVYDSEVLDSRPSLKKLIQSFKVILKVLGGVFLLLAASQMIVFSASYFASYFGLSLVLVGILIVGFGNALPEVYFSYISAKKGETSLILGNLMGSVIVPTTLVLGSVSLIHPISVANLDYFFINRVFVVVVALVFLYAARSGGKVVVWEAKLLLLIYVLFVATILLL